MIGEAGVGKRERGNHNLTIKELSQLYWLDREIDQYKEKLAELEAEAQNIVPQATGVPRGNSVSDRVGNIAIEIADLKTLIDNNIQKRWCEKNKLMRYIMTVDDSLMRQILTARFVDGKRWWEVADIVGGNNTSASVRMACHRFLKSNL